MSFKEYEPPQPDQYYECERCGYLYYKDSDYAPYLCYRCVRFLAKKVWKIAGQVIPTTSVPIEKDV